MNIETKSALETVELARRLAGRLSRGDCLALIGDLGAGKTQFAKGVALGLGVPDSDIVTSPTFVLMNSYEGRVPIKHYDLYRLDAVDLASLGFFDFRDEAVILMEWAEKAPAAALGDCLRVQFEVTGETTRRLILEGTGPRSRDLLGKALGNRH